MIPTRSPWPELKAIFCRKSLNEARKALETLGHPVLSERGVLAVGESAATLLRQAHASDVVLIALVDGQDHPVSSGCILIEASSADSAVRILRSRSARKVQVEKLGEVRLHGVLAMCENGQIRNSERYIEDSSSSIAPRQGEHETEVLLEVRNTFLHFSRKLKRHGAATTGGAIHSIAKRTEATCTNTDPDNTTLGCPDMVDQTASAAKSWSRLFLVGLNGTLGLRPRDNGVVEKAQVRASELPLGYHRFPSRFYHRPGSDDILRLLSKSPFEWGFCTGMTRFNALPIVRNLLETAHCAHIAICEAPGGNTACFDMFVMDSWVMPMMSMFSATAIIFTLGMGWRTRQRSVIHVGAILAFGAIGAIFANRSQRFSCLRRPWLRMKDRTIINLAHISSIFAHSKRFWLFDGGYCQDDLEGEPYPNGDYPQMFDLLSVQDAAGIHLHSIVVVDASEQKCRACVDQWLPCVEYGAADVQSAGECGLRQVRIGLSELMKTPLDDIPKCLRQLRRKALESISSR